VQKRSQRSSPKNKSKEEFLATKQIPALELPTSSPVLAPSDFFLFQKIKKMLKGRHFDDIDDIRSKTNGSSEGHSTKSVPKLFGRVG